MAGKRFSIRYLRWQAARTAVRALPWLSRDVLMYDAAEHVIGAGPGRTVEQTLDLGLDEAQRAFLARMPEPADSDREIEQRRPPDAPARRVTLTELSGVTLLGNTGALVDETRATLLLQRHSLQHVTYHDFRPTPLAPRRIGERGPMLTMLGSWKGHRHLFHFLYDRAPKLYYALEVLGLKDGPLEVLVNEGLPPFQQDFWRFLQARYPDVRVTTVPARERWRCERLLNIDIWQNVTPTCADPAALAWLGDLYRSGYGLAPTGARRRLWISREDTKKRRLANEAEVWAALEARGFERVLLGEMTFQDQIATFVDAGLVAGTHGAGFAHLMFAPPGTGLVELFPVNVLRNSYLYLANTMDGAHWPVVGEAAGARELYRVEPAAVGQAVDEALAVSA